MITTNRLYTLIEEFPELFPEGFIFECEDGWYDLVRECVLVVDEERKKGYTPIIQQVKEKFAMLRFYTSAVSNDAWAKINEIETKSSKICEYTGESGELHYYMLVNDVNLGWMKTVSKQYAKDFKSSDGRRFLTRDEAVNVKDRTTAKGLRDFYDS